MNSKNGKQQIIGFILLLTFSWQIIFPPIIYGRNLFRQFFRDVKRASHFVVTLPDRSTRFLGPVLGPIAAQALSANLMGNARFGRIFRGASQTQKVIQTVEQQQKAFNEIRQAYRDQANDFKKQAEAIRQSRRELAENLVKGEIKFDDYLQQVADLENIAQNFDRAADKFNQTADKLKPQDVIRMLTRNFVSTTTGQIKDMIGYELAQEIQKLTHSDVIKTLLSQRNLDPNSLLNTLLAGDLDQLINKDNYGDIDLDQLKERVLEQIKQIMEQNKNDLKQNWADKIKNIVKQEADKLKNENQLATPETTAENTQTPVDSETADNQPSDDRCPSGYVYRPRSGVECVQISCEKGQIPNAHPSYTGRCVCGSAGSINENPQDPNKACSYPADYKSCPGCVYACVHSDEECPKQN